MVVLLALYFQDLLLLLMLLMMLLLLLFVVVIDPNAKEGRRYEIRTRLQHHVPRGLVQDGGRTGGNAVSCLLLTSTET